MRSPAPARSVERGDHGGQLVGETLHVAAVGHVTRRSMRALRRRTGGCPARRTAHGALLCRTRGGRPATMIASASTRCAVSTRTGTRAPGARTNPTSAHSCSRSAASSSSSRASLCIRSLQTEPPSDPQHRAGSLLGGTVATTVIRAPRSRASSATASSARRPAIERRHSTTMRARARVPGSVRGGS